MTGDNLYETFHVSGVEQAELESVLLDYFHGARSVTADEIVYPGDATEYALKLSYEDGTLVGIFPGPKLTASDIEAVQAKVASELLSSEGARVGRYILFGSVPVSGYFHYRDRFQILPVPPDAPRPEFLLGDHPFLLEFQFPATSNSMLRQARRAARERECELLATGLLEFSIHGLGRMARHHWVLPQSDPKEPWRSVYCQEMYTWPGLSLEGDRFTPTEGLGSLMEIAPQEYYSRSGISPERHLEIPSNLTALLDTFYALAKRNRERFLRACFWFQQAHRAYSRSRSASFTALIGAVEALIPRERTSSVCPECRRTLGPGATQQFAEFVERFAPGSGLPEAERKRFYGIRSALSHGGALLHSDRTDWSGGFGPRQIKEWDDIGTAWSLVRVVLVNWLWSQPTSPGAI